MMSLYNQLFGVNPLAPDLVFLAGQGPKTVGRFRDAYMEKVGDEVLIVIYTRNGEYDDYQEITAALQAEPNYVRDWVDDFDRTFRSYVLRPLPQFVDVVNELYERIGPVPTPRQKWDTLMGKLKDGKPDDPDVKNAMDVGKRIMGQVTAAMEKPSDGINVIEV